MIKIVCAIFSVFLVVGCNTLTQNKIEKNVPLAKNKMKKNSVTATSRNKYLRWSEEKNIKKSTDFHFDYFIHPQAINSSSIGRYAQEIKEMDITSLNEKIRIECLFISQGLISMTKAYKSAIENNNPIVDARTKVFQIANHTKFIAMGGTAFPYGDKTYLNLIRLAEKSAVNRNYDEVNKFNQKCLNEIGYAKYWAVITNPYFK